VSISRALELARAARGRAHPKPTVGAVVVRDGEIVGEGATEAAGRHAEVVALAAAGKRTHGATLYVTLEPCAHHGTTPPCTDAILASGVERVVFGARDPNPEAAGGEERLRAAGVEVEFVDWFEARALNEAWRTWVTKQRPFVIFKAAVTLDGRVTLPDRRWISGEESRRLVHEVRAEVDAVAVGGGTARADRPRLDARDVETPRGQPRRLVFSRGPLPDEVDLELRTGPLEEELLLEGGPTLAAAFFAADLVDKVLLFVAPVLGGEGQTFVPALPSPRTLTRLASRQVGEDVLLEAYVHEP
jgi:diaminohydroxyphosphoribosylaminopyrimidine deaminase/5-amino-6-(5-phosphoribosylamino)uracil reductase